MEVTSAPYQYLPPALRREINAMLHQAYQCEGELDPDERLHRPALEARSFCLASHGRLAAYASVLGKDIIHQGLVFSLGSLSCVATRPEMRGRGLGERVVAAASDWLRTCGRYDIAAFSCDAGLLPFYRRAAGWEAADVVLIANGDDCALRSDALGKIVVLELLSERAKRAEASFRGSAVNLGLPPGEFI
ncbi:GNAT family N-acetyltransferase [Chromobacterium phragmitis]|uniref:GNAT family N-acetyltransferase n=1 Tax=Chromobacterium phragmitis TaxID=2202141 RepID=A0A344UDB6_9NEIS|nr:GNAT family N-acetyltransferase [Chromobacterium phragmitis]AXE31884.1 GNAT family N-acetyltransferase [Chromobacterium phragmitis]AXE33264.1 GNAT family N-acetyltransferase [Chromobacterium phragmitis]